ncbi:hypothetical protein BKA58DRAFT_240862 [Alternaria rosae]|uniref:uncharacterized protein n=1 Tax=Alternaria rosae TaxID=1187941 RepID=UPI001E8ED18F|nr:uncharacterized protein BKA58DRAFT_240862 [Alternaria rosae]KAH6865203.1 hypothetical protein BKA58DRAFT_240862 [Alternaria rosae]
MPRYGPWTWSQPHNRHYTYLLADDGVTVLDTLWAGPTTSSVAVTSRASTPRSAVDKPLPSLQSQSHTVSLAGPSSGAASQLWEDPPHSRSYTTSSLRQSNESMGTMYGTGTERVNNEQQDGTYTESWSNYTTQQYGSPRAQSYGSAHASTTTAFASSPYPQQDYERYNFRPFSPRPAQQTQQAAPNMDIGSRRPVTSLPFDVQSTIHSLDRRYIQTNLNETNIEPLDSRYRRVAQPSRATFFVLGRVFKMLWTEPAGQANPGKTRNSTHFSTVQYGETAFSEIRRFLVVRNKGDFSHPIQTYRGRGAAKLGVRMCDHGVIHTSVDPPNLLPGEELTKYSIQVRPTEGEKLESASRVNYGKAYAVEHNVKVLDVGLVIEPHRYLVKQYFDAAMLSE